MSSPIRAPALSLTLLVVCICSGCDLWDDDDGGSTTVAEQGPQLTLPEDPSTDSGKMELAIPADDADGEVVAIDLLLQDGSAAESVVIEGPDPGDDPAAFDLRFPRNGTYLFLVLAEDDDGNTTSEELSVDVAHPDPIDIAALTESEALSGPTPSPSVPFVLRWIAEGDEVVLRRSTGADGVVRMDGLIGPASAFALVADVGG